MIKLSPLEGEWKANVPRTIGSGLFFNNPVTFSKATTLVAWIARLSQKSKQIISRYGKEEEISKLYEEMFELQEAIEEDDEYHVAEELCDVMLCLFHLINILGIDEYDVFSIMDEKADTALGVDN